MMNLLLLCSLLSVSGAFAPVTSTSSAMRHSFTLITTPYDPPVLFADHVSSTHVLLQRRRTHPETATKSTSALHVSLTPPQDEQEKQELEILPTTAQAVDSWEKESKLVELVLLITWAISISAFILMNNFVGPWPEFMHAIPERVNFALHMLGGMLFGGGVILTTAIEWLVAKNRNSPVLSFWFDKVPLLDALIVLPALTVAMMSGTGLTISHYGGLNHAPVHISIVFYTLVAFATWWALTDLTTQGQALQDVNEWAATYSSSSEENNKPVPEIVDKRFISNIVSCIFIFLIYLEMVFKPGTLIMKDWF